MAFPVPAHLPRKRDPQDVSTKILTKISEATTKSLSAQLASSWITELDETLSQTKERIHERIANDLSAFNEQMTSAKSIQERLQTLTSNVDQLDNRLSDPQSGLVPTLLGTLIQHGALAQESLDADVHSHALSRLLHCKDEYYMLESLVHEGRLPEAVKACQTLEAALQSLPEYLGRSSVIVDIKRNFTATRARAEEQLTDAFMRSVRISPYDITIYPSIQVRQTETILSLPSIVASLSSSALASHLSSLRRDITTHYVDRILKQPADVTITSNKVLTGTNEHKLSVFLSPPDTAALPSRLQNLSMVFTFLDEHLFPCLPESERSSLPLSLCKPIRQALLNYLLVPSTPSSMHALPDFLALAKQARQFEEEYICSILGDHDSEREIAAWTDGIGAHYERKRRAELLEKGRLIVVAPEDESRVFYVDVPILAEQDIKSAQTVPDIKPKSIEEEAEVAWDFDDDVPSEEPSEKLSEPMNEENGWDFDDDVEPESAVEAEPQPTESNASSDSTIAEQEQDPGDAWGWNDDDASETLNGDDTYEDDPWGDPWQDNAAKIQPQTNGSAAQPKPAKRFERLTSKGKGAQGTESPPVKSPALIPPPPPTPLMPPPQNQPKPIQPRPSAPTKETFMVSGRTKDLMGHVRSILDEATQLASSGALPQASSSSPLGLMLSQAAPLTLELFRAIYPVKFASAFESVPKLPMRFSNDCIHLSLEVGHMLASARDVAPSTKEKLAECEDRLRVLGDSWFQKTIDRQCRNINEILAEADGFVETMDQDRFDRCENAVNKVLQRIRRVAQQWKAVLNKSKFYDAIGSLVDSALSRILADVLALPDITEAESHRLNELCHILNALEGLFVENAEQPSFVVAYVPSWLKFSYLSELLEASIADISYLFEEGALVDFEIDELVKLVKALFADTPLRSHTVAKLLRGHPTAQGTNAPR
ncbi:hypothetical protein IEO21_04799 [Rhodonia placenta]|uniref:Retrograde transport protein Dsl1 C-terminal domain-containing protein n=1 Tax=Rhodonia placenta TaxID=104341 RepID=A0A8H7P365_9APHY|nr:hypothetical protein IEO21_04799 [Postia placenta]